mgnify:CR=1 FL=1
MSNVVTVKSPREKNFTLDKVKDMIARDLNLAYDAKVEELDNLLMLDLDALKKAKNGNVITYTVDLSEISHKTEVYLEKVIESE